MAATIDFGVLTGSLATKTELGQEAANRTELARVLREEIGGKAAQAALTAIGNALAGKASQADIDAINGALAGKASQQAVTAISNALAGKASQTDVDTIRNGLGGKAAQSALAELQDAFESLTTAVAGKARQDVVDDAVQSLLRQLNSFSGNLNALARASATKTELTAALSGKPDKAVTDAISDRIAAIVALQEMLLSERPGDAPAAFTASLAGGPPERLPMLAAQPIVTEDGTVVEVTGASQTAMRRKVRLEPGRTYRARAVFRRRLDTNDPANDAVRFSLAWYDQGRQPLTGGSAVTVVRDFLNPKVIDGRQECTAYISAVAGDGEARLVPPYGARYVVAYIQTFGGTHRTTIEVIDLADVTDASLYSPDVSDVFARLDGIDSQDLPARIAAVEGAVGTPQIVTFASRAAAAVAPPVPASCGVIQVLGFGTSADGGGGVSFVYTADPSAEDETISNGSRTFALAPTPAVRPTVFGAKGNGAPSDFNAFSRYRRWGRKYGEPIRLDARTYNVGPAELLEISGVNIAVTPGARLAGRIYLSSDVEVDDELPVDYDDGTIHFTYILSPRPKIDTRPLKAFLQPSAVSRTTLTRSGHFRPARWGFPLGDADKADDPTAAFDGFNFLWPDLAPGQPIRVALAPAVGGQEEDWHWTGLTSENALAGVAVAGTTGVAVFLVSGEGYQITRYQKPVGVEQTQKVFTWRGSTTDFAHAPRYARWSYRVRRDLKAVEILINGVVIHRYVLPASMGWVVEAGPAVLALGPASISATALCREIREHFVGGPTINGACLGDSLSDSVSTPTSPGRYPVQWPHYLAPLLDGSGGIRVASLVNLAEGGTTMADARARFTEFRATEVYPFTNLLIVFSTANDIQRQTLSSSVFADLLWVVSQAQDDGITVIVTSPHDFYSKPAGGGGIEPSYPAFGAPYRAIVKQVAALRGCGHVDGERVTGYEAADWLSGQSLTQPLLIDNLHGGPRYAAQMGHAQAYEVMSQFFMPAKGAVRDLAIPPSAALSGYVIDPASRLDRSADGLISLDLTVTAPVYGPSDNVMRLPRNFWPRRRVEAFVQYNNVRGVLFIYGLDDGPVAGLVTIIGLADNTPDAPIKVSAHFIAAFG